MTTFLRTLSFFQNAVSNRETNIEEMLVTGDESDYVSAVDIRGTFANVVLRAASGQAYGKTPTAPEGDWLFPRSATPPSSPPKSPTWLCVSIMVANVVSEATNYSVIQ